MTDILPFTRQLFWSACFERLSHTERGNCCSIIGRISCVAKTIFAILRVPFDPFYTAYLGCAWFDPEEQSRCHFFIDCTVAFITTPLRSVIMIIRCVAGFIIHPGIIHKQRELPQTPRAQDLQFEDNDTDVEMPDEGDDVQQEQEQQQPLMVHQQ